MRLHARVVTRFPRRESCGLVRAVSDNKAEMLNE